MAAEIIITSRTRWSATGRYVTLRFDRGKATSSSVGNSRLSLLTYPSWRVLVAPLGQKRNDGHSRTRNLGNVGSNRLMRMLPGNGLPFAKPTARCLPGSRREDLPTSESREEGR